MSVLNIAAYKFVPVPDPGSWQLPLKEYCERLSLKGTIILATEGINLFLAGEKQHLSEFLFYLKNDPLFGERFIDLEIKESLSDAQPFRKMLVRLEREIITMRQDIACPSVMRAPAVDADTLRRWLDQGYDDQGRELVMLDTRDDFEVEIGTFKNAVSFPIRNFTQFPAALEDLLKQTDFTNKTIVSFCTGGIRCEKAVIYMQKIGLDNVFQLDGGILRYFERVGGEHWQGECFVFDERVALDPSLQATSKEYLRNTDASASGAKPKRKRTRKRRTQRQLAPNGQE